MKSSAALFHGLALSILLVGAMPVSAATVVFTSDVTIAASDPTHDGADIIVDGCTVTVEGSHTYSSVLLRNGSTLQLAGGGVLKVSGLIEVRGADTLRVLGMNTTGKVAGQWQGQGGTILANNLTVHAGALITADGQGYLSGQGPGADPDGNGGGSHGGEGFNGAGRYGSAREPVELGSGGSYATWSGSGGGAIRLVVTNLFTLGGEVSADGQNNAAFPGGAGGSIWVTAGTISGAGKFTADGGAGGGDNDGGGGRIAVYSDQLVGFSGFGATTATGDSRGQRGTVGFYNRAGDRLTVYDHFIFEGNTTTTYAQVEVKPGAKVLLNGMGKLAVAGTLRLETNAVLWVLSSNRTARVEGLWQGEGGTILANNLTVDAGALITADNQGYLSGQGPGADPDGGGGGSHGGEGSNGTGRYGSAREPVELGSGGSYATWSGSGGGAIRLVVTNLFTLGGEVSADGQNSAAFPGGAGGSIWVTAGALSGAGKFTANGGAGGGDNDGGGGRIAVYSDQLVGFSGFGATTATGDTHGQRGTVGFYNRAGDRLTVYDHFIVEGDTTTTYAQVEVKRGATVLLNGMGTLAVAGTLRLETNAVLWVLSSNRTARVEGLWQGEGGTILANNLTVDAGALITADNQGYVSGQGPGADPDGSGGGSYGGEGFNGTGRYGSAREPIELGSGGSYATWSGSGGGAIRLVVTNLFALEGEVSADGQKNASYPGGAGGSIWVTAGALSGAGKFTANGGAGGGDNDGGGGRIAVYSDQLVGFSGAGATTATGDTRGQRGTVGFYNRAGDRLTVYDHFIFEGDLTTTYAQVEVKPGAKVLLNGMGTLAVAGTLRLETNAVLWVLSSNRTARVEGLWQGEGGTILANNLSVDAGALITADTQGYLSGQGPGADPDGGGGGSHGGEGSNGTGRYGSAREPVELGSGGSHSTWSGSGGGAIRLVVTNLFTLGGEVSADGQNSAAFPGGAGGSIWVTAGALSGAGKFTADGGAGGGDDDGGGGRIAVYSDQMSGFSGSGATTAAGDTRGQRGTVGFCNRAGDRLTVYDHFIVEPAQVVTYSRVTLHPDATLRIFGESLLEVSGEFLIRSNATVWVFAANRDGQVDGQWRGTGASVYAGDLTLEVGARITADGQGYLSGLGPGARPDGIGGGSHGGRGRRGADPYGLANLPVELGSGGSYSVWSGAGGGAIRLLVTGTLRLEGEIEADGQNSAAYKGGAGGSIWIDAGKLIGSGAISARGGAGGGDEDGGGGRVAIYAWNDISFSVEQIDVAGDTAGAAGTVVISRELAFEWIRPWSDWLQGTEELQWAAAGFDPRAAAVVLSASREGQRYALGTAQAASGSVWWNTLGLPDGEYQVKAVVYDGSGAYVGEAIRRVLLNNSVAMHAGLTIADQVWSGDRVHVVTRDLILGPGVRLTVLPGAVVKFLPGVKITINAGATLEAIGTADAPILFTSGSDDAAGGDTNLDGDRSVPQPGDWVGFVTLDSGAVNLGAHTALRYLRLSHSGTLAGNETWHGTFVHHVPDTVVVPSGVTLSIEPGAVIKFDKLRQLIVQRGGVLRARGTVAQPIVFTSIVDDTVGGDLNGDGDATVPAPGDWRGLLADGGVLDLQHVVIGYAGNGGTAGTWDNTAAAIATRLDASVTVSNSVIRWPFFEGIIAIGSSEVTLANTVIHGADRGVNPDGGTLMRLWNCTLDDNRIGVWGHGGRLLLVNTIISGSLEAGIDNVLNSPIEIRHCNVWSATGLNFRRMQDPTGTQGNLSVDPAYKNADRQSYRLTYGSPGIDSGAGAEAPPTDAAGAPRYDDPRVPNTGTPTVEGSYADLGAFEFVEGATSDLDLVVVDVRGPAVVRAGQPAEVSWTVRNLGEGIVTGTWHDRISLAPVTAGRWDEAREAGLAVSSATLGPNGTAKFSATVFVPGGTEGDWRWQVRVNALGEVFEGLNWNNNLGVSPALTRLHVSALAVGATVDSAFRGPRQPEWYRLDLGAGQEAVVVLNSAMTSGRCRVYAGYGSMPTETGYDVASTEWNSPDARLGLMGGDSASAVYLAVLPEVLEGSNPNFSLAVSPALFALESIDRIQAGNAGWTTVTLRGSRFADGLGVSLEPLAGPVIQAQQVLVVDRTRALARFNLQGTATGSYDVAIELDGLSRRLTDAFTIVPGLGGRLETRVLLPAAVRAGRAFTGYVEYRNTGDADLPAALLTVRGTSGSPSFWAPGHADQERAWVNLLAVAYDSPVRSTLPPGGIWTVPFECRVDDTPRLSIEVSAVRADDSARMDYDALANQTEPDDACEFCPEAWALLVANSGLTRGDYVMALADAADRAGAFGLPLVTEQELLGFMLWEARQQVLPATVSGHLYRADLGQPVGRCVLTLSATDKTLAALEEPIYRAQTWFDGSFGFTGVPAGTYALSARGYLPDPLVIVTIADPVGNPVSDLWLVADGRAGTVQGYVTEGNGGPAIGGLPVRLVNRDTRQLFLGRTDALGYYRIHSLLPGVYELTVAAPGWLPEPIRTLTLRGGETALESFALSCRGGTVNGVVRTAGGAAVNGAAVRLDYADASPGGWSGVSAVTDREGRFVFAALPPGRYTAMAVATGHGVSAPVSAVLESYTAQAALELVLTSAHSLSGQVVTAAGGLPVAGASVSLGVASYGSAQASVTADGSGAFAIGGLAPGTYDLWATAPGYEVGRATVTVPGASVRLELLERGRIFGSVHNGDNVVTGLEITVLGPSAALEWSLLTDAAGQYAVGNLLPGDYSIAVGPPGGLSLARREITLSPSKLTERCDFNLDVATLAGRVFGADGSSPWAGAVVSLIHAREEVATVITAADGSYRFLIRRPGEFLVVAMGAEGLARLPAPIAVAANAQLLDRNLSPGNRALACGVYDAAHNPIEHALVAIYPLAEFMPDTLAFSARTGPDGICHFAGLPAGNYRLRVTADGRAPDEREVTVPAVGTETFVLAPGRRIEGRILALGKPVAGTLVSAGNAALGTVQTAVSDAQGHYVLDRMPKGLLELTATRMGDWSAARHENVDTLTLAAQTVDLDLVAASGSILSGTVANENGLPVSGAMVVLRGANGAWLDAGITDEAGVYRLTRWPLGSATLEAIAEGYLAGRQPVELTEHVDYSDFDVGLTGPVVYLSSAIELMPAPAGGALGPMGKFTPDFLTRDFWRDVLSGDFGLPPPSYYANQLNADGLIDRWRDYYFGLDVRDTYCLEVGQAFRACSAAEDELFDARDAFAAHWRTLRQLNQANVAKIGVQNAVLAAKLTKLAMTLSKLQAQAALRGQSSFAPSELERVIEDVADIGNLVSLARSALLSGDWRDVGSYLTSMDVIMSVLKDSDWVKKEAKDFIDQRAGPVSEILSIMVDFKTLYDDYRSLDHGALSGFATYQNDVHRLVNAVTALHRAYHDLRTAVALCRNPPPEPPGDTPPPPPDSPAGGDEPPGDDTEPAPWGDPIVWDPTSVTLNPPAPYSPTPGGWGAASGGTDVLGSLDPNDKLTVGFGDRGFIGPDTRLHYTIRFENMTNAALPAFRVTVTDQLSPDLDWSTFALGNVQFNGVTVSVPPNLRSYFNRGVTVPSDPNPVEIAAGIDPATGRIDWRMESVDRVTGGLPDDPFAGFLPPNTNAPAGEGFVSFYIRPRPDAWEGLVLVNTADIVFDYNESILTPPVTNTVDTLPPSSAVHPLPEVSPREFTVRWSGSDGAGSGIASYDLFVSDHAGPWRPWLTGTTATEALFRGEPGVIYHFYSVARDGVGHTELLSAVPDAGTLTELRILDCEPRLAPEPGWWLRWESATNKSYEVLVSTNLTTGFRSLAADLPATPPQNVYLDATESQPARFYLIRSRP